MVSPPASLTGRLAALLAVAAALLLCPVLTAGSAGLFGLSQGAASALSWLGIVLGVLALAAGARKSFPGRLGVGAALGLIVVASGLLAFDELSARRETLLDRNLIEQRYERMWLELDSLAEALAADLSPRMSDGERLQLFEHLRDQLEQTADPAAIGVLLFDANGEAVAWYGAGLLHEPAAYELPLEGRMSRRGYTAVTALSIRSFAANSKPWRVVVGRSLSHQNFPFAESTAGVGAWSLAEAEEVDPETWRVAAPRGPGPALFIDGGPRSRLWSDAEGAEEPSSGSVKWSLLFLSLACWVTGLVLLALRQRRGSLLVESRLEHLSAIAAWIVGGVGLAASFGASLEILGVVAVALASAVMGVWLASIVGRELAALQVAAVFAAFTWILAQVQTRLPLTSWWEIFAVDVIWSCLAVAVAFLGHWIVVPQADKKPGAADRWLVVAAGALILGAALHDEWLLALTLGAVGCAATALWWARLSGPRLRASRLIGLMVLASVAASLAWQVSHRWVVRNRVEHQVLPILAPPSSDELNELLIELHDFFDGYQLDELSPPPKAAITDAADLPYALWRDSPLPLRDGLSAVVVESGDGQRFLFSFGLAFSTSLEPLPSPARWPIPPWPEALIQGQGILSSGGEAWGRVRFWFMPRPGFRRFVDERRELERNLVRGKPRSETADGLPAEARYALYDLDGRSRLSPWDEAPPLAAEVVAGDSCGRRQTPDGLAWCWTQRGSDGIETLFLPWLGPQVALERVGVIAMVLLPMLALIGIVALAGAAPRDAVGTLWRDSLRSYSRRLILVFTLLLLLPLIALNLVLLRSAAERLRQEQLVDARDAMVSARTLLLDYLRGLEPGFLIETQVHRELLEWIGGLVGHQVNLYWGSRLYASSQQEMFTAGLLPSRIPGEVYTRLSLLGSDLGFRRQQTGDLAYLEVYTPIDVPGIVSSQQGLFLSVPLLEQEEDAARDLTVMRRRAFLVTSALLLITLAVAGRLSRRFTEPIVQLIEGTRRIARGQTYKPVEPRETELKALAAAIGEMAEQVAASRRGLEREKHFVERVVANITSAVVSLDLEHRVALQNRVAAELLGTAPGEAIDDALARNGLLAPVREFVASAEGSREPKQVQVKLRPDGERVDVFEWSLTWVPIAGGEDPAALLVVDDSTEVLRGQRLEAWAEMARIIAHEIKNPLTPIQLSTEHLQQVYKVDREQFEPVLERCSSNILRNVAELREIASEFSIYSRIPAADLQVDDLVAAIAELAANYRDAPRAGVDVEFHCALERLEVRFDRKLLGRAVRNLMENALRATAPTGGLVSLGVEVGEDRALITVTDSGPGVDPQKLERIFEPYFSTYESGTGLGLAITRRIVEEHSGEIEARNRPAGGLSVLIRIPITEDPISQIVAIKNPSGSRETLAD